MSMAKTILENERIGYLKEQRTSNLELAKQFINNTIKYEKLILESLKDITKTKIMTDVSAPIHCWEKLGLDKFGIISCDDKSREINYVENVHHLKQINWDEFIRQLNLRGKQRKKLEAVASSVQNYIDIVRVFEECHKKVLEITNWNIDAVEREVTQVGISHTGEYVIYMKDRVCQCEYGLALSEYLLLEQLYDEFRRLNIRFKSDIIEAIDNNLQVCDQLRVSLENI